LEISIIRPFNMYGPKQNIDAYAAVVPITIRRILNSEKPVIEGDGEQTRDLTYVEDVTDAALKMLESDLTLGRIVNVGQGKETKIKDIISTICNELNYPFENVEHAPPRPADVRRLWADITLAKKLINYAPKTDFHKGLNLTIKWLRARASTGKFSR